MLTAVTLRNIAQARLEDARILLNNGRLDGAGYICGYAVELALKARICDTLNWSGFPENRREFENLQSFRTHNLDVLLTLSGREQMIKQAHFADWSIVCVWNPEARYHTIGQVSLADAQTFLASTTTLLPLL
jgi:HEPN domain-containing protein